MLYFRVLSLLPFLTLGGAEGACDAAESALIPGSTCSEGASMRGSVGLRVGPSFPTTSGTLKVQRYSEASFVIHKSAFKTDAGGLGNTFNKRIIGATPSLASYIELDKDEKIVILPTPVIDLHAAKDSVGIPSYSGEDWTTSVARSLTEGLAGGDSKSPDGEITTPALFGILIPYSELGKTFKIEPGGRWILYAYLGGDQGSRYVIKVALKASCEYLTGKDPLDSKSCFVSGTADSSGVDFMVEKKVGYGYGHAWRTAFLSIFPSYIADDRAPDQVGTDLEVGNYLSNFTFTLKAPT